METTFNQAIARQQEGRLEEAEKLYRLILETDPTNMHVNNNLGNLLNILGRLNEAEECYRKSIEFKPDHVEALNNLGNILAKLNKLDEARSSYKKAIKIKPNYAEAYNNLGIIFYKLGKLADAEINNRRAIELKTNYAEAYNNLGATLQKRGKLEEAFEIYVKVLTFDSKNSLAQLNLINILDYYLPSNKDVNPIIIANNNLKKIKNNLTIANGIKKFDIINLFKDINIILNDDIRAISYDKTQIIRSNEINLNCIRHFEVFNKFNVIPKFCFSCFKIQIEPKNVLELIKLYFIFDKLDLPRNNVRKCMIEVRPNVLGSYKGFIYCSSVEETNAILEIISPIINKSISAKVKIKRGCTDFAESFPSYKEVNKKNKYFMKYKEVWKKKEIIIDNIGIKNLADNQELQGLSVSNILIINNWLNYAKKINDLTYKHISKDLPNSHFVSKVMSEQLNFRRKEFHSGLSFYKKILSILNINL